ncbi:MAG TPA: hypothetical protein VFW29_07485 [Solirubrobacteraceae bacterium]|nr:hypothetical protein [Solirubrobacteraceae bacterium]
MRLTGRDTRHTAGGAGRAAPPDPQPWRLRGGLARLHARARGGALERPHRRVRGGTPATRPAETFALRSDPVSYRRHESA